MNQKAKLSLCFFARTVRVRSGGQRRRQRGRWINSQRRQIATAIARQLQHDRQRRRHHDQQLAVLVHDLGGCDTADHQKRHQTPHGRHRKHCRPGQWKICVFAYKKMSDDKEITF